MNKKIKILFTIVLVISMFTVTGCDYGDKDYGVFIGAENDKISTIMQYKTVVIEPTAFEESEIAFLKACGCTVYGYINIGSVKEYRDYYEEFEDITLDEYEGWPDEKWVDVSQSKWQDYVVDTIAAAYAEKGLDGFFVDNTDVYYQYQKPEIFLGLMNILQGLRNYNIEVIINGGDTFVTECIDDNIAANLFTGVNQESVFTAIDFENDTYVVQSEEDQAYFKEYLRKVSRAGLKVFVIEYHATGINWIKARNYYNSKGYTWYNAQNKNLE
ncbi:MAG: endo alpha-1,4 polygalactosaminidase [Butyrivibrio sp.]|nr:endo alpha-1,4 polygalactosaminidase [Butyrivibrio sp.]